MQKSNYQIYSTSEKAWDAMYEAIKHAKESIYWEIYIFVDDEAGIPFFELLQKKARQGLDVKIIVDAFGSFWLSRKRIKLLKQAGVDIRFFGASKRFRSWFRRLSFRTHRKMLVIDETVGFIGGVNIHRSMRKWLDIHARIEGKVVHSLLRSFARSYIISGGKRKKVKKLLRYKYRIESDGEDEFVESDGHSKKSKLRHHYTEMLLKARERVILFSPYYLPDKQFIAALWRARKRGVKVDLLLPLRTDIRVATYVAYSFFSLMKKMGVNVRLTKEMMHGKGMVVDNEAIIGSANLDKTSFYDNFEGNVHIKNKDFVSSLKKTLEGWIDKADDFDEKRWKRRGRIQKLQEWVAIHMARIWHRHHE